MSYNFKKIEKKWANKWEEEKIYKVQKNNKPKFYILDMFPYPSGAGLHVGHPLGYIGSDIMLDIKGLMDLMYFILWDLIHLVFQLNNTQF